MINFGVFSPSSRLNDSPLNKAQARCTAYDATFKIHPQTYLQHHQSAGFASEKIAALNDLMHDDTIQAIWASIGGNRAATIFDHIPEVELEQSHKPIIGFSDVTFLLNALYELTGQIHIHAACLQSLNNPRITNEDIEILMNMTKALLNKERFEIKMNASQPVISQSINKPINGRMIGGNLSVFQTLIGTKYLPKAAPFILFLEDIGDHLSRYDRMFRHLSHSGLYKQCNAILLGDFGIAKDESRTDFGFSLDDIFEEHFGSLSIPIFKSLPFGHRGTFTPLPVGAKTQLSYDMSTTQLHISFDFND